MSGRGWAHLPGCYGCGRENACGLRLELSAAGDSAGTGGAATATGTFGPAFVGAPGLVHGGALMAMLDEVMGTVPGPSSAARVTRSLEVRFRRPVALGRPVVATARVVATDGRRYRVTAELRYSDSTSGSDSDSDSESTSDSDPDDDSAVRAEAEAEFVVLDRLDRLP